MVIQQMHDRRVFIGQTLGKHWRTEMWLDETIIYLRLYYDVTADFLSSWQLLRSHYYWEELRIEMRKYLIFWINEIKTNIIRTLPQPAAIIQKFYFIEKKYSSFLKNEIVPGIANLLDDIWSDQCWSTRQAFNKHLNINVWSYLASF